MMQPSPLQPASQDDIPALHALIQSAYRGDSARGGWTHEADLLDGQRIDPDMLAELMADPAQRLYKYSPKGELIGCVQLTEKGNGLFYLGMLTVSPAHQAGGYGKAMLVLVEAHAKLTLGAKRIEMTVIAQRKDLIDWYIRRGYSLTGERRAFPAHDPRFGIPKRDDLEFVVLEKVLT